MRIAMFQVGDMPGDLTVRAWRRIMKAAAMAVGVYYETELKAGHFEEGADRKYGYAPRTARYLRQKRGRQVRGPDGQLYRVPGGGLLPLVYTGRTRAAVMRPHIPRAFPTRVNVDMPTPSYITMRPGRGTSKHRHGLEIAETTPAEVREMESIHAETMERELQEYRSTRRRKVA